MKILSIKFSETEQTQIFNELVNRFDDSRVFERGMEIEFNTFGDLNCVAFLELYNEGYNDRDTNDQVITQQSVVKFTINFYDLEGDEIHVANDFDYLITNHYTI